MKKAKETQKQTIRKLIEIPKTSKDKQKTAQTNQNSNKPIPPMVKYINNANSCTLSFPKGYDYPLAKATAARPIPIRLCVVCGAKRRYSCSKTKVSLCSLKCYKENFRGSELVPWHKLNCFFCLRCCKTSFIKHRCRYLSVRWLIASFCFKSGLVSSPSVLKGCDKSLSRSNAFIY